MDLRAWAPSRRTAAHVLRGIAGQGAVQAVNLAAGLLLLRWLSVESFAQYSLATAFQAAMTQLVDMGIGGAVIALVGPAVSDPDRVGLYVSAARSLRRRLLLLLLPGAAVAFVVLASRQDWAPSTQALLGAGVVATVAFQGWTSYYAAPLLMQQRLGEYYSPQLVGALVRILACLALWVAGILTGWLTIWLVGAATIGQGLVYRHASARLRRDSGDTGPARREMLAYVAPMMPAVVFNAVLGQMSVLLATAFGRTPTVAETGALGRIGQPFLVLAGLNTTIVGPRCARLDQAGLRRFYARAVVAAVSISAAVLAATALFPEPLLFLLGRSYRHLGPELVLAVAATCLNYVGLVMWSMHAARRWVFWWATWLYIVVLTVAQLGGILLLDLSTTRGVMVLAVASAAAVLGVQVVTALVGFSRSSETKTARPVATGT